METNVVCALIAQTTQSTMVVRRDIVFIVMSVKMLKKLFMTYTFVLDIGGQKVRTKDELFMLGEVSTLLQYLFMSEKHTITFNNGLTDLQIRMDENFNIWCRNLQFSDIPESNFNEQMTTLYMLGVIQILQNTPPVEFKNAFANRWEEIKQITLANLALNRKQVKMQW